MNHGKEPAFPFENSLGMASGLTIRELFAKDIFAAMITSETDGSGMLPYCGENKAAVVWRAECGIEAVVWADSLLAALADTKESAQ